MFRLHNAALILLYAMPLLLVAGRAPSDIGLSIIASLFLIHTLHARQFAWLKQWDMRILLVMFAYLCVQSLIASDDARASFLTALKWLRFPMFYAALRFWLLTDARARLRLANITLIVMACAAVDTLWQYIYGTSITGRAMMGNRLTGSLSSPNIGNYLLKMLFPAVGMLIAHGANRKALFMLICVMVIVPLSGERGTALLMMLSIGFFALIYVRYYPHLRKYSLLAIGVIAVIGVFVVSQPIVQARWEFLLLQLQNFGNTEYYQIFSAAYHMWLQNPLLGVGLTQFHDHCTALVNANIIGMCVDCESKICNEHAHNIYLQFLSETGLIGLLLFSLFAVWCVRQAWRSRPPYGSAHAAAFIAMATTVLVVLFPLINTQNIFSNWPGALFWFTLGYAISLTSPRESA